MKIYQSYIVLILQLVASLVSNGSTRADLAKIEFLEFDLSKSASYALFQQTEDKLKQDSLDVSDLKRLYQSILILTKHCQDEAVAIEKLSLSPYDKSLKTMELLLKLELASKNILTNPIIQQGATITDQSIKNTFLATKISDSAFIKEFNSYNKSLTNKEFDVEKIARSTSTLINLLKLVTDEVNLAYTSEKSGFDKTYEIMVLMLRLNRACELLIKKPSADRVADVQILKIQHEEAIKSGIMITK